MRKKLTSFQLRKNNSHCHKAAYWKLRINIHFITTPAITQTVIKYSIHHRVKATRSHKLTIALHLSESLRNTVHCLSS